MGDRIEFPHNQRMSKMYFDEAIAFMDEEEDEKALEKIQKIYAYDKSPDIVQLYASILAVLGRYEEALEMADTEKDLFINSGDFVMTYTVLLLLAERYMEAEYIIGKNIRKSLPSDQKNWQELYDWVKTAQRDAIENQRLRNESVKEMLLEIENYSIEEQFVLLKEAKSLNLSDLQEVAEVLFANSYISGQMQRFFLEILIEKQDPREYDFVHLKSFKTVKPSELYIFREDPHIKKVFAEVTKQLEKYPTLFQSVHVEVMSDLLRLYPFVDETVPDIPYFVNYYVTYYDVNNLVAEKMMASTEAQETVDEWLQFLNKIAGRTKK